MQAEHLIGRKSSRLQLGWVQWVPTSIGNLKKEKNRKKGKKKGKKGENDVERIYSLKPRRVMMPCQTVDVIWSVKWAR